MTGMIINSFILGPPPPLFLDSVESTTCCDLDATIAASFTSGQTWANLTTSPNDGAGQTDYDFFLGGDGGSSTDDPSFTGSAGDAAAYFALDGADIFTAKDGTGSPSTPTMADLHKNTSAWWIMVGFRTPGALTNDSLCGNGNGPSDTGIRFLLRTNGEILIQQYDGADTKQTQSGGGVFSINTDHLLLMSVDMAGTTNNVRFWVNTTSKVELSETWSTETATHGGIFRIASTDDNIGNVLDPLANGYRIYSFAMGNALINDAEAIAMFAHMETRHDRDYTP